MKNDDIFEGQVNMNYKIRYIKYNNKTDDFVFEFNPEYALLSIFLSVEITAFADWIKEKFDKVLSGKSGYEVVNGNICCAEISPVTTRVYDNLAEDAMGNWCEVDTRELRQLIEEWCEEMRKFNILKEF